jgi:hypothetical protein
MRALMFGDKQRRLESAKDFLLEGNYRQAKSLYEGLLKARWKIDVKNDIRDRMERCSSYIEAQESLGAGEAQFPVVLSTNGHGCTSTVRTKRETLNGSLAPQQGNILQLAFPNLRRRWDEVSRLVEEYLGSFAARHADTSVLNWGWDCWIPIIRQLPHDVDNRAPDPTGYSCDLALAIAIISEILNEPVGNLAFTGGLESDGGENARVTKVEGFEEKIRMLFVEHPDVVVVAPTSNRDPVAGLGKAYGNQIRGVKNLDEAVRVVFKDLEHLLVQASHSRRLGSDWLRLTRHESGRHVLHFESARTKPKIELTKIAHFYRLDLPGETRGLILNGPFPLALATWLVGSYQNRYNNFFIAVSQGNEGKAIVTSTKGDPDFRIGDQIEFQRDDDAAGKDL